MKIASWNVNSLSVRLAHVLDWLNQTRCDLLGLQELKLSDDKFPVDAFAQAGYHACFAGQKTYNGVAWLSRLDSCGPASQVQRNNPRFEDEQQRLIAANYGDLRVICGYFPNGESLTSDKFQYKVRWLDALHDWVAEELQSHPKLLLAGDFNIAPTDADVHDPALWAGQLHCSDQEREQFARLLRLGLHDSFRLFEQPPKSFSWWDYRQMAFRRNAGLRIDHILVSDALKPLVIGASIDKAPRKLEKPSDHTPVIVELKL